MDWEAWARKAELALDVAGRGDWKGLFATEATFALTSSGTGVATRPARCKYGTTRVTFSVIGSACM